MINQTFLMGPKKIVLLPILLQIISPSRAHQIQVHVTSILPQHLMSPYRTIRLMTTPLNTRCQWNRLTALCIN